MKKKYITKTSSETKKIGEFLAKKILRLKKNKPILIALVGNLGGGKTTFLKGFAKGLHIKEEILSPTFIIYRRNKIPKSKLFKNFYHFDLYRIKNYKDLDFLNFKNIISTPGNIVALEWADVIYKELPPETIFINFGLTSKKEREIILSMVE